MWFEILVTESKQGDKNIKITFPREANLLESQVVQKASLICFQIESGKAEGTFSMEANLHEA